MNRLSKIKLINWMYFQNQTIDIDGSTVITGGNASGKSTILDAIQMLILGNQASKFNSNAEGQKRTLESYVRGAITTEAKEFLRPTNTITYLAMEFIKNNVPTIFAIFIDFTLDKGIGDSKYITIDNVNLTDEMFIEHNKPRTFDSFLKYLRINEIEYKHCATLYEYQFKLKEILGLKNVNSYFQTLKVAIGIKNIQDINQFIYNFVLEEKKIDLEELGKNVGEIEKLNRKIEKDSEKLNDINNILDLGNQIKLNNNDIDFTICKSNVAKVKYYNSRIDLLESDIANYNKKKNELEFIIKESQEKEKALKLEKDEYNNELDKISPDLKQKKKELDDLSERLVLVNTDVNTLNSCMDELTARCEYLNELDLSAIKDFSKFLVKGDYKSVKLINAFQSITDSLDSYREDYNGDVSDLTNELKELKVKIEDIQTKIDGFEKNKIIVDEKFDRYKNALYKHLCFKYKKNVEVNYLYELIDVKNDEWRNAIEGYLGLQKFHIIVDKEYYNDAIELYHSMKDVYDVNIVDAGRIKLIEPENNTLGSYITATNANALNYALYILNRVYCAESVKDLNKHDISITKDCMRYQNYTVARINPKHYTMQYLGSKGRENSIKELRRQKKILNDAWLNTSSELTNKKTLLNAINSVLAEVDLIWKNNSLLISYDEQEKINSRIDKLSEQIKFFENDSSYITVSFKLEEVNSKINEIIKTSNDSRDELVQVLGHKESKINEIENLKNKLTEIKLDDFDKIMLMNATDSIKDVNVNYDYILSLGEELKRLDKRSITLTNTVEKAMVDAISKYSLSLEAKLSALNLFDLEAKSIDTDIQKYKTETIDIQNSFKKVFLNTFIDKLYNNIEEAKKNIKNLNNSLAKYDIEKYSIKETVTQDSDLRRIYEFARVYGGERTMLNYDERDNDEALVTSIISRYLSSNSLSDKQRICDYRNYLDFDIIIDTPVGKKSYKQVCKVQSGGEGQVPFYMLAAVAFMQTLDVSRNNDCLAIVLFDEVFDKMDSDRIREMLKLYDSFKELQLVIALPNKIEAVVDMVGSVKVVVRNAECASILDYGYHKTEQK